MKIYKPYPGKGVQYGILFLFSILLVMGTALIKISEKGNYLQILPIIIMVFLISVFGCFIFIAKTLSYIIEDNFLIIKWGFSQKKIDLNNIGNVEKRNSLKALKVAGAGWPGLHIGTYTTGKGMINLFATRLIGDVIVFRHKCETIGITPENPEEFLSDLKKLIPDLESKIIDSKEYEAAKKEEYRKNSGIIKVLAGINAISIAVTYIWLKLKMNSLPARIPMHVGVNGIDRYGSPEELYLMPTISLVFFIIMFIITRYNQVNRTSVYMFLGGSIIITLIMNLAILGILSL